MVGSNGLSEEVTLGRELNEARKRVTWTAVGGVLQMGEQQVEGPEARASWCVMAGTSHVKGRALAMRPEKGKDQIMQGPAGPDEDFLLLLF